MRTTSIAIILRHTEITVNVFLSFQDRTRGGAWEGGEEGYLWGEVEVVGREERDSGPGMCVYVEGLNGKQSTCLRGWI